MGKVIEQKTEAERLGSIVNRLVRPDEGYVEFQLRQAMADAISRVGKERAMQIAQEAAE